MRGPQPRPVESPLMTLQECAEYLQISKSTLYRLMKSKTFPGFRLGADWRFRKEDVLRWLESQSSGVPSVQNKPPGNHIEIRRRSSDA